MINSNYLVARVDNLQVELEKSFSIQEVKEIVKESKQKDYQQLEQIKN